jgi:hypothetical protein
VALPGQVSEQIGLPSASITTPTITCLSSGRWSFDLPCCPTEVEHRESGTD